MSRVGQVWACVGEPDMIHVLLKQLPTLPNGNESYLALYLDSVEIDDFDTDSLESDELWERLA